MRLRAVIAMLAGGGALALGGGCSLTSEEADLVAGKEQFVEKCAACHTLRRAGTGGTTGPNLDEAFRQAIADGMGRSGIRGAVRDQIRYPADVPEDSPAYMPPDLVTGDDVDNVAAYVAAVAAKPGEDTGLLAEAGTEGPTEVDDPEALVASGDAQQGAQVFTDNCAQCHGAEGGGGSGPALTGNAQLDAEGVVNQILQGGGAMPPFAGRLSEEDLGAVSAYVLELSER